MGVLSDLNRKRKRAQDKLKDEFDAGYLTKISDIPDKEPALAALVYQVGLMQEELDYLRTEISSNKDKTTFPGLGTSSSTALAGDTRIPAFTADDTSQLNTTKSTAITFGNFTTTVVGKTTTYTLPITVVETTVVTGAKPSTTTLTKTGSITLT